MEEPIIDGDTFHRISHRGIAHAAPISDAKIAIIESLIPIEPGQAVLDIGCGRAEWLIQLAERYAIAGTGVDRSAFALDEARSNGDVRAPGRLGFLQLDALDYDPGPSAFDIALCVGSTYALGGYRETFARFRRLVKPGGYLVIGEGYWQREPDQAYLDSFGGSCGEMATHAESVSIALEEGLIPLYAAVSSPDDRDHYEGRYAGNVERYAMEHAGEPGVAAELERIRRWRDGYLRWGRSTMGFALYLHRVPVS